MNLVFANAVFIIPFLLQSDEASGASVRANWEVTHLDHLTLVDVLTALLAAEPSVELPILPGAL